MEDEAIEKMLRDRPQLLRDAADRADAYLVTLGDRRVSPAREAIEGLAAFDAALPGRGLAADKVLARLDEIGSAATVAMAGPRFFGFVNGGALPIALATAWMVAAWDQNNALRVMSPVGGQTRRSSPQLGPRSAGPAEGDRRGLRLWCVDGQHNLPRRSTGRDPSS
jgi:hypothetical protein